MSVEPVVDRYYSIHLSRWPVWLVWKQLWRNVPLFAPLLFPLLLLQRIPGLKPDPQYASIYPENLNPVPMQSVPSRPRTSLEARIREAEEQGFRRCQCFHLETLGTYEQYDFVMLNEAGDTVLQVRWHEMESGNYKEQETSLYCSSTLAAGGSLSSSALAKQNVVPEMQLPDDQSRVYPVTTSVEEIVRFHREAIPEHAKLVQYDCESLLARFRVRSKLLVDTLLERRIYFELTPRQIHKLQEQDAQQSAEKNPA